MTQLLWELARKARQAQSDRELGFVLVNETLALVPYRQAPLFLDGSAQLALLPPSNRLQQ